MFEEENGKQFPFFVDTGWHPQVQSYTKFGARPRTPYSRMMMHDVPLTALPPPPPPPSPHHYFLQGRVKGRARGRRVPYDAPIFPAALPPLHPVAMHTPGAAQLSFLERRGGGRYKVPMPTLPPTNLTKKTPNNSPTCTTCRAPPKASSTGGGRGLWGFGRFPPQPFPPAKVFPPPFGRGHTLGWGEGGTAGAGSLQFSRPRLPLALLCKSLQGSPQTPPSSCTLLPDIPVKGRPVAMCRITAAGEGSGCPAWR